ncbi:MAG: tRNA (N6-isopentenyl adenosine(37)-C2)-methylthiotransferase MiaB [Gammaproteobacteria bacterium]|nr:tRNA (N6-isopentenyl adenosine(37)-C2)-methylthiotransferase MiaB [Gammaproteobacteria bacterium]MBQ09590.1 tRNA (N6-isopentenyl adenosine(37)-C2)-methylthiotransferase MiaB [Gammaproteobacteria bacterium]MDP6146982.1 tRNA (N6-isopentenyl adenosine(37)-C2)-methylthiotransferase MiaB [Gammaproteobacteria bacterium]HJL79880.1 tRNA (N6-isopentenyl adenosine(37)-C2)-methylthiotransferase MiaB [Gammaproteobacteria bacterium]HJM09001.1 tRNA (N6-isopentenyl adenosine(37)-C2)-methylthiotransferase M
MTKKVFIKSFGCQMNEYDSSKMVDMMCSERNMQQTKDPAEADLILLNTCSIREKPQEKVFSQLGRWKPLKTNNPELIIGVGGCVASQEGKNIIKRAPYVDMVFGPQTLHRLPKMYDDAVKTKLPSIDTSFPKIEKFSKLPNALSVNPSAFVSIMEGCSKFCSFCVVPYTRGLEVSRPPEQILNEIKNLSERGVREINLLGQNVNAYRAKDIHGAKLRLADLLQLVADINGVDRIRFTTSHPLQFTDDLISSFENKKLANYLHLPVQSGSDRILKLMERKHKVELYIDRIEKLRAIRSDISISSDFIVGFPGETNEDFEETMNLINIIGFDQSFSFIFSSRPNTPAADMFDDVPYEEKLSRLNRLQALINVNANKISQSMIGTEQNVLVEKQSKKDIGQISGRTENNRWVNFDGPEDLIGSFVNLTITEALPNSLRARLIN